MSAYDALELGKYYSEKYLKESGHINNSRAVGAIYDLVIIPEKSALDEDVKSWKINGPDESYVYRVVPHGNGALDVVLQDVFNRSGDIYLLHELNSASLAVATIIGEYTLTLDSGHGFIAEDHLSIFENGVYFQATVINVVGDEIEINLPIPYPYTASGATVKRSSINIEESDGSTDRVTFKIGPPPGSKWDIYSISFAFRGTTDMDDAKFIGLAELERGCFVAKNVGYYETRFSFRNNSDMKQLGQVIYSDKAPAGEYGLTFTKSLKNVNGVAIRLDGDNAETLDFIVSDDLSDLSYGRAMVAGHIVEEYF